MVQNNLLFFPELLSVATRYARVAATLVEVLEKIRNDKKEGNGHER